MYMTKVHVWIGVNYDENFDSYFELDYSELEMDIDDPQYQVCPFCKDINELWYDEDLIGVYVSGESRELVDVAILLDDLSVSEQTLFEIKNICSKKGIERANSMFYYMDPELVIHDTKKLYNKLTYLGCFDTDL